MPREIGFSINLPSLCFCSPVVLWNRREYRSCLHHSFKGKLGARSSSTMRLGIILVSLRYLYVELFDCLKLRRTFWNGLTFSLICNILFIIRFVRGVKNHSFEDCYGIEEYNENSVVESLVVGKFVGPSRISFLPSLFFPLFRNDSISLASLPQSSYISWQLNSRKIGLCKAGWKITCSRSCLSLFHHFYI